jgi:hypothetical protein
MGAKSSSGSLGHDQGTWNLTNIEHFEAEGANVEPLAIGIGMLTVPRTVPKSVVHRRSTMPWAPRQARQLGRGTEASSPSSFSRLVRTKVPPSVLGVISADAMTAPRSSR